MDGKKTVILELFLKPRSLAEPVVKELVRNDSVIVDLLRARISSADAWLRLRISGPSSAVDAFVQRHRDKFIVLLPTAEAVA